MSADVSLLPRLILVRSRDRVELGTGARGAYFDATMHSRNCRRSEANGHGVIKIFNDQEVELELAALDVLDMRSLIFKKSSRERAAVEGDANRE